MSWLVPPVIKNESKWKFNTFGTGGVGVGFVAASGGTIVLDDPSGKSVDFWYGGAGAGVSIGLKIGKFKVDLPGTATVGPKSFPSTGKMYVLDNLENDELSKDDIQGPCAFFEAGGGVVVGASGTAMYVGLDAKLMPMLALPGYGQVFINSAKGLLLMAGVNEGFQAGAGAAGLVGYLS